jgi:hypothetical protein
MQILKFYRRPDRPEFAELVRTGPLGILINHPLDKPYRKRTAEWITPEEVRIAWCRRFTLFTKENHDPRN